MGSIPITRSRGKSVRTSCFCIIYSPTLKERVETEVSTRFFVPVRRGRGREGIKSHREMRKKANPCENMPPGGGWERERRDQSHREMRKKGNPCENMPPGGGWERKRRDQSHREMRKKGNPCENVPPGGGWKRGRREQSHREMRKKVNSCEPKKLIKSLDLFRCTGCIIRTSILSGKHIFWPVSRLYSQCK